MLLFKRILNFFKSSKTWAATMTNEQNLYIPVYRVISFETNDKEEHYAVIQVINKSQTFKMKPEEILADDRITSCFSPLDIRSLTYLGYLGINSPKYKILANQLCKQDNNFIFAIKEKGKKKPLIKRAEELLNETEMLTKFEQDDIYRIGYTIGSQTTQDEKALKEQLIKSQLEKPKATALEKEC